MTAHRWLNSRWLSAGLVLAAALAYAGTWSAPFVFDDHASILDNPSIRHLGHLGAVLSPPFAEGQTVGGRPLLNLSLAINYAVSGPEVWSYHLVNWLIHVAAGLTLFGLVRRGVRRWRPAAEASADGIGFAIALLWTVHPLQTESVTYVVQRAESLMGLFYLLTLYCFERWNALPPTRSTWPILSVLCCLCGMATKEVMVSAPVAVLLYDRLLVSGDLKTAWKRHWPLYCAQAATWIPLLLLVLSTHGRGGTSGGEVPVAWSTYLLTQFPAVLHYLRLVVWPHPLIFYYEAQWVTPLAAALPALVVGGAFVLTLVGLVRNTAWGFLGGLFFAVLAPTSLIPGIAQTVAEHRMYLALAPVITLLVCSGSLPGFRAWVPLATLVAVATTLTAVTYRRNQAYRSSLALWQDTVDHRPLNPYAHNDLGEALVRAGQPAAAIAQFEESLRLNPRQAMPNNNLANVLKDEGRFPAAALRYQAALAIDPRYAEASNGLGVALTAEGRNDEAVAAFQAALRLKPEYAEAWYNLGVVQSNQGNLPAAIADYRRALSLRSNFPEACLNLGNALVRSGQWDDALAQYQAALRLKPDYALAQDHLQRLQALMATRAAP